MKFHVEVNPDETIDDIKEMADQFIAELFSKYMPFVFLFMVILTIILILTSCCGAYLAIWLHKACHCRQFRCCFWIECNREDEHYRRKKRRRRSYSKEYSKDDDKDEEVYV